MPRSCCRVFAGKPLLGSDRDSDEEEEEEEQSDYDYDSEETGELMSGRWVAQCCAWEQMRVCLYVGTRMRSHVLDSPVKGGNEI
eukprot:scaffold220643_cov20-Tisochrysis_lutea.AAC.1